MQKGSIVTGFLSVALLCASTIVAADQSFVVVAIEDGDTLLVEVQGAQKRIQLAGLDAPEDTLNPKLQRDVARTGLSQDTLLELGRLATQHLGTLAAVGEEIRLEGDLGARDKYGRTPMLVYDKAGSSINEAMIGDGFAVVLSRSKLDGDKKAHWQSMEQSAIKAGVGIWVDQTRQAALKWSARAAP